MGKRGKGRLFEVYVYFVGSLVAVIVLVIVESVMEGMSDVAVRSEHSRVDKRGLGGVGVIRCYRIVVSGVAVIFLL